MLEDQGAEGGSTLLSKGPCGECGSSDACATYDDGHTHCYSCGTTHRGGGPAAEPRAKNAPGVIPTSEIEIRGIPSRSLTEETCRKWGYGQARYKGRWHQVAQYRKNGAVVAQHLRDAKKEMPWVGNAKAAGLFGQHLWRPGQRRVVITEGEVDAMSVSQVQQHKWPVVSIKGGSTAAADNVRRELEWVLSFDEVVIAFDMDAPGRAAAEEVAALLKPGQAYIAELPMKDANEMLVAGRAGDLVSALYNARKWQPDGLVFFEDDWEDLFKPPENGIKWPWEFLNAPTYGVLPRELVTILAASGAGKSSIIRELILHFRKQGHKVGTLMLEENPKQTRLGLLGLEAGQRFGAIGHVPPEHRADAERNRELLGSQGLVMLDTFGSLDLDVVENRIRYMVQGLGCNIIMLDHISIMISGLHGIDDERKALDIIMTRLRVLVEQTGCTLFVVSHLSRPPGDKGHEDGIEIKGKSARGSHSIIQLSDGVLGAERDQQSDDEVVKNTTRVRIIKWRRTGDTGVKGYLYYDLETGRLTPTDAPNAGKEKHGFQEYEDEDGSSPF